MGTRKVSFRVLSLCILFLSVIFLETRGPTGKSDESVRPEIPCCWAERVEQPGLPNFFRVSGVLYRGGQPEKIGVCALKKLGIKTVINLRQSKVDEEIFRGCGMDQVAIPMNAFFPRREGFRRFLGIVSDPARLPVFVHCRYGSDRTGAAVAIYRIKVQNWSAAEAIREMVDGPYGFHWIHGHLKRFVRRF
jgi:tyrosine-protein phosphatase SIW14